MGTDPRRSSATTVATAFGGRRCRQVEGGEDDDLLEGGGANDRVDGAEGNDTIIHATSDGSDNVDGGADTDKLNILGSEEADVFDIGQVTSGLIAVLTSPRAFRVEAPGVETITWAGFEGDDSLDTEETTHPFTLLAHGGEGDDAIEGGPARDVLNGGDDDDSLVGNGGPDDLTGGLGIDAFTCDELDLVADFEPGETQEGCFPVYDPPPAKEPDPVAPVQPGAPADPGAPAAPGPPSLPPAAGGLARPRVTLVRKGVRVVLSNPGTAPVAASVAATERRGRKLHRYRRVRKAIAPGARVTVTLKAPRALLRQLRKRGRGKRRPTVTVTNLATGALVTARVGR